MVMMMMMMMMLMLVMLMMTTMTLATVSADEKTVLMEEEKCRLCFSEKFTVTHLPISFYLQNCT